jgi:outer membrane protein assembly factor BamB
MRVRLWVVYAAVIGCSIGGGARAQTGPVDRWVTFRHDYQRTGRSTVVGPQTLDRLKWRKPVASDFSPYGAVQTSPAIGLSGRIFVSAVQQPTGDLPHTYLACMGPDGSILWRLNLGVGQTISSPSLANDDTLYVGVSPDDSDGKRRSALRSFDAQGNDRWTSGFPAIPSTVFASPALDPVNQHTVYVGSHGSGGLFYAIDFATGAPDWISPEAPGWIDSPAAVGRDDGVIYFGSQGDGGRLNAVTPELGEAKWTFNTEGAIEAAPALSDSGVLFVGSLFGVMYAVNAATGSEVWSDRSAQGGYYSSPALGANGVVYVGNDDGCLYAFDAKSGSVKWRFNAGFPIFSSPAVGGDGTIYFGCDGGVIYALNPDGTLKSEYVLPLDPESSVGPVAVGSSPAIGPDGTLYVGADDGFLYAFQAAAPLAGDISQNGRVDVSDATLALRSVIGIVKFSLDQVKIGDVAPKRADGTVGDGMVRIDDVVRILRRAVGLEPDPWP